MQADDGPAVTCRNAVNPSLGDSTVTRQKRNAKWLWLVTGFAAGITLASIWPHEPVAAYSSDRNDKFAIISVPVGLGSGDAVFVLDFLTGRLTGAAMSRTRSGTAFISYYYRNLAEDFQINPSLEPQYAITVGSAEIQSRGGNQWGSHAVYVAELSSGKVAGYPVPYTVSQVRRPPVPLFPIDTFPFREATVTQ